MFWFLTHVAVPDISPASKPVLEEELGEIATFHTPQPHIAIDGKDFSSFHAFHRSNSNIEVESSPAKTVLMNIRSEIRKEELVLLSTRKYKQPLRLHALSVMYLRCSHNEGTSGPKPVCPFSWCRPSPRLSRRQRKLMQMATEKYYRFAAHDLFAFF